MQDASADTVSVDGGNDTFEDVTDDSLAFLGNEQFLTEPSANVSNVTGDGIAEPDANASNLIRETMTEPDADVSNATGVNMTEQNTDVSHVTVGAAPLQAELALEKEGVDTLRTRLV
eukprot:gene7934-9427_t